MIPSIRPAVAALVALIVTGCQTASLEDAAPKSVPVGTVENGDASIVDPVNTTAQTVAPPPDVPPSAPVAAVINRNPGVASLIPIEKTAPVENKEFVAAGANRTGQFPLIGRVPSTANAQISDAEKSAAEAEIAELLRLRAAAPDARAQYAARLRQLRALAASHAADTQRKIEN